MSQPTGTGQQSGQDPSQQSGSGEPQGTTGTDPTTGQGSQQSGEPGKETTGDQSVAQQLEDLKRKLSLSDKRAQEAESKLTAAERAKMDETERTKAELADAKAALEKAQEEKKALLLEKAFLEDSTYTWRNKTAALKLADLSNVTIDVETGKVEGLKAALDKLAKSDAYLLEEANDGKGKGGTPPGSTGVPPGGGQLSGGPDNKQLASRFPAMRTRGIGT
jgi:hypothetical protein